GGLAETTAEGERLLNEYWRVDVPQLADMVIATVVGSPAGQSFSDLAAALASAARVVSPGGRIILLCRSRPDLGRGADLLRRAEDPGQSLDLLRRETPLDMAPSFQWATSAQKASIFLLSELPLETAEELFVTPLESPGQVQRLLSGTGSC